MSYVIITAAIECDMAGCDSMIVVSEHYSDEEAFRAVKGLGWTEEDGVHLCRTCSISGGPDATQAAIKINKGRKEKQG